MQQIIDYGNNHPEYCMIAHPKNDRSSGDNYNTNGKLKLNLMNDATFEEISRRIDNDPFTYSLVAKPLTAISGTNW